MNLSELSVKIHVNDTNAINKINNFSTKMTTTGKKITKIGAGLTVGLTLPLIMAGKSMFNMASDFEESLNKVQVSFGDASGEVEDFAKTTLKQFGIAEGTTLEMASLFGDMSTSMGLTTDEAATMSKGMVGLAGDLASFKNVGLDVAQTALAGVFTGETESLKKLGIVMTEANLKQFAMEQGLKKNYKELTQAEKVQLRYAYVTQKSKNAVGDFANTADSSANVTRTLSETIKEVTTSLGQELLPIITPVIVKFTELVQWFGSLDDTAKVTIITTGLFLAALGPVVTMIGTLITVVGLLSTAFTFLSANPIVLIIAAIVALIAIGVLLYQNWETVSAGIIDIAEWLTNKVIGFVNSIIDIINVAIGGINALIKTANKISFVDIPDLEALKHILTVDFDGSSSRFDGATDGLLTNDNLRQLQSDQLAQGITEANTLNDASISQMTNGAMNTGIDNVGVKGINQTVIINAPTELNPREVARQTTQLSRAMALGLT